MIGQGFTYWESVCLCVLIIGASLSEPHLVCSVAGSASRVCIHCRLSLWATG